MKWYAALLWLPKRRLLCHHSCQETKTRMMLANRDAIEDDLKKELRQLKQTLAEAANAQQMQKGAVDEQKQANETHKTEMAAAHSQITSLTRDVSALRAQLADHANIVEQNKQLNNAVTELDKAFANAEKRVRLA